MNGGVVDVFSWLTMKLNPMVDELIRKCLQRIIPTTFIMATLTAAPPALIRLGCGQKADKTQRPYGPWFYRRKKSLNRNNYSAAPSVDRLIRKPYRACGHKASGWIFLL